MPSAPPGSRTAPSTRTSWRTRPSPRTGSRTTPSLGDKVADDSLTGADVDESTLEGVDAATLNGSASYFNEIQSAQQTSSLNTNDRKGPVTATCPDGTVVIAGGASIVTESGTKLPIALTATTSNAGNGWNAEALEIRPVDEPWGLRVVALCGVLSGG